MKKLTSAYLGLFALVSASGTVWAVNSEDLSYDEEVRISLQERLPKTQVSAVDCSRVEGLCEVISGDNLFYVDRSARYLIVGRVYDMETRQDLTAARLLEVNPSMLMGGSSAPQESSQSASGKPSKNVSAKAIAALPSSGAISYGNMSGPTLTVFSDFNCVYCKRLYDTLRGMNVRVIERPISVMGSREVSERVVCSSRPELALKAAYSGNTPSGGKPCDTSGLDANETFAAEHGFGGTPVLVRSDGAVMEGWRPKKTLEAWLKEGA